VSFVAVPRVVLEPTAQTFVDSLSGPPLSTLSPADARAVLDGLQAGDKTMVTAEVEPHMIPGGPSGEISITVVRPVECAGRLPVVVYLHGGGWVLGNFATHERLMRELAVRTRAAMVFVHYSRSPEVRYPTAIEEAYAATKWVAERGVELGLNGRRLAIAGDSAGGNMTAVVTLLAKERGGPRICFQALFYPVTDAGMDTDSYKEFAEGPWLTRASMEWFWDAYCPDMTQRCEPTLSPLRASLEQLSGLPPALVITAEADVLRDEGEAYARKLRQAGVDLTAVRYAGIIHDFMMLNALADTNAARSAVDEAAQALKTVLYRETFEP
jgi:acetyl esterase